MVWGTITQETTSTLVLMPTGEQRLAEFVRHVNGEFLSSFWLRHHEADCYVLMENKASIYEAAAPKFDFSKSVSPS